MEKFQLFKTIINFLFFENIGNIILLVLLISGFFSAIYFLVNKNKKEKKDINNNDKDKILNFNINTNNSSNSNTSFNNNETKENKEDKEDKEDKENNFKLKETSDLAAFFSQEELSKQVLILSSKTFENQFEILKNKIANTEKKVEAVFTEIKSFLEDIAEDLKVYTELNYKQEEIVKFFIKNLTAFTAEKLYNIVCQTFFDLMEKNTFEHTIFYTLLSENTRDFIEVFSNLIMFLSNIDSQNTKFKIEIIKNLYIEKFINEIVNKNYDAYKNKNGELKKDLIKLEFKKIVDSFLNEIITAIIDILEDINDLNSRK